MSDCVRKPWLRDCAGRWIIFIALLVVTPQQLASGSWWIHDPAQVGDWFEPDNWSEGLPVRVAYINNGGTVMIAGGNVSINTAYVGYDTPDTARIVQTGGALMGSTGTYQNINLGYAPGTRGEYEISGDSYLQTWQLMLGFKGTGVFRQSGGTVNASVFTARDPTATGIYEMSGGTLNAPYFEMGGEGSGRFTLTDGTVHAGYFQVGYSFGEALCELLGGSVTADFFSLGTGYTWSSSNPPAKGTGVLAGAAQLTAKTVSIGGYGPGDFTQTGGALIAQDDLYVAYNMENLGTGTGKYRITGGDVTAKRVHVGHGGQGALEIVGSASEIRFERYEQTVRGRLVSEIDATGLSPVQVSGVADLAGVWEVIDAGAPFGRFDVLIADAGIAIAPGSILLPGSDWTWGIDAGTTLWVEHVPEPVSLTLFGLVQIALLRRETRQPS